MRATVKDVAERAGVSPKTVSNVINGVIFVRPETKARVDEALAALNYVPNLSARGLRNGRSGMIGLALPDLLRPYSAEITHLFVELAHERGWGVQIEQTAAEPQREWELLSKARAHLVDGLILNPINLGDSVVTAGPDGLPPVVLIGDVDQDVVSQVCIDNVAAAVDMVRHLLAAGYRRIAAVGTPEPGPDQVKSSGTAAARLRTIGYRQALTEAGLPIEDDLFVPFDRWNPENAAEAVTSYLRDHDLPDAFFCFTDTIASGVLSALWHLGIAVPGDVGVAGFDNVTDSEFAVPPLTTVDFSKRDFVTAGLELLEETMRDRTAAPRRIVIPHRIIARASTGTP